MPNRRPMLGAFWLIAQPLVLNAFTVPAVAFIIRQMGPKAWGLWSMSSALVTATLFLTNLGVRTLFVRAVAQHPERASDAFAEQLGLRSLLSLGAGCVAVGACLALRYPPVVLQCTLIGMLYLLCCGIASSVSDLLYATERMAESAGITFVQGIVLTAASVGMAALGWGPVGMAWAYMLGPLTAALLALSLVQRKFFPVRFRWSRTRFLALLRESRALTAQLTVETLNGNVESVLVPKLLGATVFGYYSAGLLPASRLTVVSDGLSTAFYPIIARKWVADRREAAWEAVRFWMLSTGASAVIALGSLLLAPLAAGILFPKDPGTCRLVISVTVWSLPLLAAAEAMAYSLNASGHHGLQAKLTIAATPISLAVTALLIWKLGLVGACYIWITRPLVTLCFYVPAYVRIFGPHLKGRRRESDRVDLVAVGPVEAG